MYAFVDRPVDSLCNGGRFLLWAMRGWVGAAMRGACPPQALHRGFGAVHARAALPDFHVAMALLASDGRDCLALSPMACRRVGEDEAVLLGLWRDAAGGAGDALRATLALLVEPSSVGPIAAAMAAAATHLTEAGFDLPLLSSPTKDHQESK
ncbi:hypothetical protein [Sphingopyxis sp. PET50]|uniref:hypothetical protein n=1 Tax=Sphingopyxis sp. PET50 TaxID=2976533 RepID=UPI0021AE3D15|nr:hypothetical protein [Sphingopyxis sp. PET50]